MGAITTAIMTAAAIHSSEQQYHAGKQAERAAGRNAAAIRAESKEAARRSERKQAQQRGRARAAIGAGGATGSLDSYLQTISQEQGRDINWLEKSAQSRAGIAEMEGRIARTTATAGAASSAAGALSAGGKFVQDAKAAKAGTGSWF